MQRNAAHVLRKLLALEERQLTLFVQRPALAMRWASVSAQAVHYCLGPAQILLAQMKQMSARLVKRILLRKQPQEWVQETGVRAIGE
jgi:hypothetical protein